MELYTFFKLSPERQEQVLQDKRADVDALDYLLQLFEESGLEEEGRRDSRIWRATCLLQYLSFKLELFIQAALHWQEDQKMQKARKSAGGVYAGDD